MRVSSCRDIDRPATISRSFICSVNRGYRFLGIGILIPAEKGSADRKVREIRAVNGNEM